MAGQQEVDLFVDIKSGNFENVRDKLNIGGDFMLVKEINGEKISLVEYALMNTDALKQHQHDPYAIVDLLIKFQKEGNELLPEDNYPAMMNLFSELDGKLDDLENKYRLLRRDSDGDVESDKRELDDEINRLKVIQEELNNMINLEGDEYYGGKRSKTTKRKHKVKKHTKKNKRHHKGGKRTKTSKRHHKGKKHTKTSKRHHKGVKRSKTTKRR